MTPEEPALDDLEIQGNVIPGFLKPHMAVIALTIDDVTTARRWVAGIAGRVTSMREAMRTRVRVREHRLRHPRSAEELRRPLADGGQEDVNDAWFNLGFSHQGLERLFAGDAARLAELESFTDPAFRLGLPRRAAALGDPTDPAAEGHPGRWVVGAPGGEPDLLLIFAADRADDLTALRTEIAASATAGGLRAVYEEQAAKLNARGAEHFGFKDGISQPGVRGRWGEAGEYITPRTIDPARQPEASLFGLPGQHLVWPGEFVFGYPGQAADPLEPGADQLPGPAWSRNGSYLVFRRLRQDVPGFWEFIEAQRRQLEGQDGFRGLTSTQLASYLIGRWPSGAPVARSPDADDESLGANPMANNHFDFGCASERLPLTQGADDQPPAAADPLGLICPLAAHIRKVNSREAANDGGGRRSTFTGRILRRGLPFGPALDDPAAADPAAGNRGLLFISYQASIAGQFELLCSQWMGDPTNPRMPSGHDMVVGQNGQPGESRERHCVLVRSGTPGEIHERELHTGRDFVIPTGGGYFFSPSISALRTVIGG